MNSFFFFFWPLAVAGPIGSLFSPFLLDSIFGCGVRNLDEVVDQKDLKNLFQKLGKWAKR